MERLVPVNIKTATTPMKPKGTLSKTMNGSTKLRNWATMTRYTSTAAIANPPENWAKASRIERTSPIIRTTTLLYLFPSAKGRAERALLAVACPSSEGLTPVPKL